MQGLPKFLTRDGARKAARAVNALMGDTVKASDKKGNDGLWKLNFRGGVLTMKGKK